MRHLNLYRSLSFFSFLLLLLILASCGSADNSLNNTVANTDGDSSSGTSQTTNDNDGQANEDDWDAVLVGASPRASQDLLRAARARAFMDGRAHVEPDDIKRLCAPLLAHRLVFRDQTGGPRRAEALLEGLVDGVAVPT